jgi:hypothetical protein
MLFHVSEDSDIRRFEPRPSVYSPDAVVWAITAARLCNYLVPRDCPRVTFYGGAQSRDADIERFLGSSTAVVAIESGWLERVRSARLYCYEMPSAGFDCFDACAGYFVSRTPVVPSRVEGISDPLGELVRRGVEVRILQSLWSLRDAVAASSLPFSFIRMCNAIPRAAA